MVAPIRPNPTPYASIPTELQQYPQWVVWRAFQRENGKLGKMPYSLHTGQEADPNNPETWITYAEAVQAVEQGKYDGIGFVFTENDPFTGIDLDDCIADGEPKTWAWDIIEQFNSYTEISPSGTGVKIFIRSAWPLDRINKTLYEDGKLEIYRDKQFFTVTGQRIDHISAVIEDREEDVAAWYTSVFPAKVAHSSQTGETWTKLEDNQILAKLRTAKNAAKFERLWSGNTNGYTSRSEADIALFGQIAFYTQDADQIERIARLSGLYRDKWDAQPAYLQDSIEWAIERRGATYQPKKRIARRIDYTYPWQQAQEDRDFPGKAQEVKESVRRHFEEGSEEVLVIQVPPGVGKSTTVSEWGQDQDIAYIVERHDQYEQIKGLGAYRHIQGCSSKNCPEAERARKLSILGYNTWPFHRGHNCEYYQQFQQPGSAMYQIAHAQTAHPVRHKGIVVDELNLGGWMIEHAITASDLQDGRARHHPSIGNKGNGLLTNLWAVLAYTKAPLYGKALFDRLDADGHSKGWLEEGIQELESNAWAMEARPILSGVKYLDDDDLDEFGRVVIPTIVNAIKRELPHWTTGQEWNSRIRVEKHEGKYALLITEPRQFQGQPSLTVLDATAHRDLFSKLFRRPITAKTIEIDPPPNMKHIAVRTGKRYSKFGLTEGKRKDEAIKRVVKELRYLLNEIDPDNTKTMGLITYDACQNALGEALGILEEYRGHFWGVRGSNAFEDCEILLIVGTPTPNLDGIINWTRALYADDLDPIDTGTGVDDRTFQDARLKGFVDYLVNAELTQAAHRNRPLRHDGRVVVTLTGGHVDFLPITTEFTSLPNLDHDGMSKADRDLERLRQAVEALQEKGVKLTVQNVVEELGKPGINRAKVAAYVKGAKQ